MLNTTFSPINYVVKTYLIRFLTSIFTICTLTVSVKSFFAHLNTNETLEKSYQHLYILYIVLKALYKDRSNK